MKSATVKARPGHTLSLSKIDPGDMGTLRKEGAVERFEELREKISELQVVLYAEHRHSLQLEIKRTLYMDEATFEPSAGFLRLEADLARLTATIAGHIRNRLRRPDPGPRHA